MDLNIDTANQLVVFFFVKYLEGMSPVGVVYLTYLAMRRLLHV